MVSNEDIVFDSASGISIEEQKEILAQINGIAEKNRRALAEAAADLQSGEKSAAGAKKKGAVFPLAVNIAAVLFLAGGVFSLFTYNSQKDFEIKTGTGSYFLAGQTVIEELTAAQEEALLTLRELSGEQERAAGIDAYLSGAIAVVSEYLLNDMFDEAAASISELKIFLDTPSFELNRTFLARKEFYVQSINSLEKLIDDIRRSGYSYVMALEAKNAELEDSVETLETNVRTLSAGNAEQNRRINQLEDTVSEKDRSISSLETEKNTLNQTVSDLQTVNTEQDREILRLNNELNRIRQALQALTE